MTSTQDKLSTSLEICYQKIVPVENTDIHRHWLFHILLLSSEAVCDSSNSSFSPFLSLFCLSCPLLLSSHGPWPWLHVKPDTPHSLFSHHAVTSSAHHTALAMASLYLSLSVFFLCCTSVGLASAAGLRWALRTGQLRKSKKPCEATLKLKGAEDFTPSTPQQCNAIAAQNLTRSPAIVQQAMGAKHIPAHMITCAPAHTLALNIIQVFLNETN